MRQRASGCGPRPSESSSGTSRSHGSAYPRVFARACVMRAAHDMRRSRWLACSTGGGRGRADNDVAARLAWSAAAASLVEVAVASAPALQVSSACMPSTCCCSSKRATAPHTAEVPRVTPMPCCWREAPLIFPSTFPFFRSFVILDQDGQCNFSGRAPIIFQCHWQPSSHNAL